MARTLFAFTGGLLAALSLMSVQAQSVRVINAPELATEVSPPAGDAMVVYIDPDTGEFTATPPDGVRTQIPELAFNAALVTEEVLVDGTTVTWLNGQGMEALWLTFDEQGRAQVSCSSRLTGVLAGRHGDLRHRSMGDKR